VLTSGEPNDGLIVNLMDVELPLEPSVVVKHARLGKNANYNPSSAAILSADEMIGA
jgi:hypothetical protein